jgi:FkbM family methyltransferase
MKALLNTFRFIAGHPLNQAAPAAALGRYLKWQVGSRLLPDGAVVPFVENTRLLVRRGMLGATGNLYCGLHEFEDMALVLHALRPGDLFVDIGANVGSYSILAGGISGAEVIAIEPVPATFECLLDNIRLNRLDTLIIPRNLAVGSHSGSVLFSKSLDTVNHVLAEGEAGSTEAIAVPVETLDGLISGQCPVLLKVDVEGYETEVVQGAANALENTQLMAVLMELNGSGERYGHDERKLHRKMLEKGFTTCLYRPFERNLIPVEGGIPGVDNVLYVRDVGALAARVKSARTIRVLGLDI